MKKLVLDSVSSPITRRVYNMALNEFMAWFQEAPRPRFGAEDLEVVRTALDGRLVVAIELGEVDLVSRDAVKLPVQAEAQGIEITSCPACTREWSQTSERAPSC